MRVRLQKETVLSGRGGYPSISYRALLVDVDTGNVVSRSKCTTGPFDSWLMRGRALAKRLGHVVVV